MARKCPLLFCAVLYWPVLGVGQSCPEIDALGQKSQDLLLFMGPGVTGRDVHSQSQKGSGPGGTVVFAGHTFYWWHWGWNPGPCEC